MNHPELNYVEIQNEEELLLSLRRLDRCIAVKGEYEKEVEKLLNTKLSDLELLGLELGSAGLIHVAAEFFYRLINLYNKDSKIKKELKSRIRQYNSKFDNDHNLILYLRQLDY